VIHSGLLRIASSCFKDARARSAVLKGQVRPGARRAPMGLASTLGDDGLEGPANSRLPHNGTVTPAPSS